MHLVIEVKLSVETPYSQHCRPSCAPLFVPACAAEKNSAEGVAHTTNNFFQQFMEDDGASIATTDSECSSPESRVSSPDSEISPSPSRDLPVSRRMNPPMSGLKNPTRFPSDFFFPQDYLISKFDHEKAGDLLQINQELAATKERSDQLNIQKKTIKKKLESKDCTPAIKLLAEKISTQSEELKSQRIELKRGRVRAMHILYKTSGIKTPIEMISIKTPNRATPKHLTRLASISSSYEARPASSSA